HLAAAVGDDRVHADRVVVTEGLAYRVDRGQADLGGVERVDPEVRRPARVRGPADVAYGLDDAAVVRRGDARLPELRLGGRMDHHGHVHVVEVTEPQQLRLASQELELARPRLLDTPRDVAVLLGRDREEDDTPGEMLVGLGARQS